MKTKIMAAVAALAALLTVLLVPQSAQAYTNSYFWTTSQNCYFNPQSYVRVQFYIEHSSDGYWRPIRVAWGGSEHPDGLNTWETRGGTDLYAGGLANWNPGGATSGYSPYYYPERMYGSSGNILYADAQFHRPAAVGPACGIKVRFAN